MAKYVMVFGMQKLAISGESLLDCMGSYGGLYMIHLKILTGQIVLFIIRYLGWPRMLISYLSAF